MNDLVKLIKLSDKVNTLKARLEEVNALLETLNEMIEKYDTDKSGLVDTIAKTYNEVDLERLKLELRINKLEKDILHIEYEHAIAE